MTEYIKHPFTPTLTLTHHESGWDGTFGAMLHELAGVLDDGPVAARVTYWNGDRMVTVDALWTGYTPWESITLSLDSKPLTLNILDNLESLSI